jgi:hypothetical protein
MIQLVPLAPIPKCVLPKYRVDRAVPLYYINTTLISLRFSYARHFPLKTYNYIFFNTLKHDFQFTKNMNQTDSTSEKTRNLPTYKTRGFDLILFGEVITDSFDRQSKHVNTLYGTHGTEHTARNTLHGTFCTEHTVRNTLYGTHCMEHTVRNTLYGTHCTEHTVLNTLHGTHCTEHVLIY